MNSIKKLFKKYWLFIILALIVGTLLSFYTINKFGGDGIKKDLSLIPSPKIKEFSLNTSLNYSELQKEKINIKEENVYEVDNTLISDKEAISIAQKFNFKIIPKVYQDQENNNIFYEWSEEDKYLSINLSMAEIEYQKNNLESISQEKGVLLNPDQAEEIARKFLEDFQFLPPENIDLILISKKYLQINEVYFNEIKSPQEANLLQLDFQYQINEKNLLETFISVYLTKNNDIFRLIYNPSFKEIKNIGLYPLKTKEEIIKKLETINFLHYIDKKGYYVTSDEIKNLSTVSLNKIEVTYLKTKQKENYLIPLFLISGKGTLKNGEQVEISLYLPAVKDDYLLNP